MTRIKTLAVFLIYIFSIVLSMVSCEKESGYSAEGNSGIVSFENPLKSEKVSPYGETLAFVIYTEASYTSRLKFPDGVEPWAELYKGASGNIGRNTIRIIFDTNETDMERSAELLIRVDGFEEVSVAEFNQNKSGVTEAVEKNLELNAYMHKRLCEEYLWAEQYKSLDHDMQMDYSRFLYHHLTSLGDVNDEDGGYARAYAANPGERFIYSYISEITDITTKALSTFGLGIGPIFSSDISSVWNYSTGSVMGLSIAYVHQNSPAAQAGLRRGDTIFAVNGTQLTTANYKRYMTELYSSPSGSYDFAFLRFDSGSRPTEYTVKGVTTASYIYSPVLYQTVLVKDSHKIGYLVLETFDINSQEVLDHALNQFIDKGINELVLDLRFNAGGAVSQSRYLANAIAGRAHDDKIYVKVTYNDDRTDEWKFSHGYSNDTDNLGKAPELGLKRLYVITSYNTASASELIINGLRGIDFPVYLYGSQTEGKNVGMTTTQVTSGGRKYEFAPITFRVSNAKGFGDYPDGFKVDPGCEVNNQNASYSDDADNMFPYSFGDWTDFDFNIALSWIYFDIIGEQRPSSPQTKSTSSPLARIIPVGPVQIEYVSGHWGNVIYE